jgi:mono/diheme cytochrome c family protein
MKKSIRAFAPTKTLVALAAAAGFTLVAGQAMAQAAPTYTDGQANTGAGAYKTNCESCHGDRLQGLLEAPALSGPRFSTDWRGGPVKDLYDYMAQYMPQDKPGKLPPETYAAITAFILKNNNIPAGTAELPPNPPATMMIPK